MRYLICRAEPRAWGILALDPKLVPDLATAVGAARAAHARCRGFEELIVGMPLACAFFRDDVLKAPAMRLPYELLGEEHTPDMGQALQIARSQTVISWQPQDRFHVAARAELFVAPALKIRTLPIPWDVLKGLITVHGREQAVSSEGAPCG